MSKKNIPPSYGDVAGPWIVETHSKMLSPFGPAVQLQGGSRFISASSFWILLTLLFVIDDVLEELVVLVPFLPVEMEVEAAFGATILQYPSTKVHYHWCHLWRVA